MAQLLYENGARLSKSTIPALYSIIAKAVESNDQITIENLTSMAFREKFDTRAGSELFRYATHYNHTALTHFLLDRKLNLPQAYTNKALLQACRLGRFSLVQALVPRTSLLTCKDASGTTPLGHALKGKHWKISDFLKANGATISPQDRDQLITMFQRSVASQNTRRMARLIAFGLDINTLDYSGKTPLIKAIQERKTVSIQFLLSHSADYNQPDSLGHTPIMVSAQARRFDILNLLLDRPEIDITSESFDGRSSLGYLLEAQQWPLANRLKHNGALLTENDKAVLLKTAVAAAKQGDRALLTLLPEYGGPKVSRLRSLSINIQSKLTKR